MSNELDGRVAIVTGAAMGIGKASAQALSRAGAAVVVADVDEAAGRATVEELSQQGRTLFVRTDVTRMADMEAMARAAVDAFGGIDILVNNAARAIGGVVDEIDEASWNEVISTNLTSVWRGMKV